MKDCSFFSFFSFGRAADDDLTLPMPKILSEMSFRISVTGVGVNSIAVGSLLSVSSLRFLSGVQGGVISSMGCSISKPVSVCITKVDLVSRSANFFSNFAPKISDLEQEDLFLEEEASTSFFQVRRFLLFDFDFDRSLCLFFVKDPICTVDASDVHALLKDD